MNEDDPGLIGGEARPRWPTTLGTEDDIQQTEGRCCKQGISRTVISMAISGLCELLSYMSYGLTPVCQDYRQDAYGVNIT